MSESFIGEIRMFAGNFAPRAWAFCSGQLLAISQNEALFSLLGTIYGGDGRTTFALPDMRGRLPVHAGQGPGLSERRLGIRGGLEQVTLTSAQLPSHTHTMLANPDAATDRIPTDKTFAQVSGGDLYGTINQNAQFDPSSGSAAGGNQPHTNVMPFLCVNFIIALFGTFPSRN